MTKIVPAILPSSILELEEQLTQYSEFASEIQIDIVEGKFSIDDFKKVTLPKTNTSIAIGSKIFYELDLMVDTIPDDTGWMKGISRVVIHSAAQLQGAVTWPKEIAVGLALHTDDSLSILSEHREQISFIQCMGIDSIGQQGQPLNENVFATIKKCREEFPELPIQIDGGVRTENISKLRELGVSRVVVGSLIKNSEEPKVTYEVLTKLAGRE
jgi:pentose-5-phosphate-3-epimerase